MTHRTQRSEQAWETLKLGQGYLTEPRTGGFNYLGNILLHWDLNIFILLVCIYFLLHQLFSWKNFKPTTSWKNNTRIPLPANSPSVNIFATFALSLSLYFFSESFEYKLQSSWHRTLKWIAVAPQNEGVFLPVHYVTITRGKFNIDMGLPLVITFSPKFPIRASVAGFVSPIHDSIKDRAFHLVVRMFYFFPVPWR